MIPPRPPLKLLPATMLPLRLNPSTLQYTAQRPILDFYAFPFRKHFLKVAEIKAAVCLAFFQPDYLPLQCFVRVIRRMSVAVPVYYRFRPSSRTARFSCFIRRSLSFSRPAKYFTLYVPSSPSFISAYFILSSALIRYFIPPF
jgi:hypothetical protein